MTPPVKGLLPPRAFVGSCRGLNFRSDDTRNPENNNNSPIAAAAFPVSPIVDEKMGRGRATDRLVSPAEDPKRGGRPWLLASLAIRWFDGSGVVWTEGRGRERMTAIAARGATRLVS